MSLFRTREPRRFRGVHIYTSERQDKLNKLVEQAKREQALERGEEVPYQPDIESYRGKFGQNLKHLSRYRDPDRLRIHPGAAVAIIVVLLIIWHYLVTGSFHF